MLNTLIKAGLSLLFPSFPLRYRERGEGEGSGLPNGLNRVKQYVVQLTMGQTETEAEVV